MTETESGERVVQSDRARPRRIESARTAFNVLPGRRGLKTGLLGGSFDPPHAGHAHISNWALKKFGLDAVWWLPSPGNGPLPANRPASASARRTAMKRFRNPNVLNVEFELQTGTAFTHESISRLKSLCPHTKFVWLMGADNLAQIHTWSKWDSIFESVPVGVLARRMQFCRDVLRRRPKVRIAGSSGTAHFSFPNFSLRRGCWSIFRSSMFRRRISAGKGSGELERFRERSEIAS